MRGSQRTRSSDTQRQRKHCFQEPAPSASRTQLVTLLPQTWPCGSQGPSASTVLFTLTVHTKFSTYNPCHPH